jgi:hypothetical protein
VELLSPFSPQYAPFLSPDFAPQPRQQAEFEQRHLQAQVQGSFFRKYNSRFRVPATDSAAFYGLPDEQYRLDDFTRFKVMEEILREYVPGVQVRLRKDGFHFQVTDRLRGQFMEEAPLVLLDGVPVFNPNKIMAMDPLKVEKLEVVDRYYFQGTRRYSGIISFSTYKGDLADFPLDTRVLVQQYEGLQQQREFYAPRYETAEQKQSRLPDLRNLLYWNPSITTNGAQARQLEFFTGDQAGRYLMVIQGLTAGGQAGSTSVSFEVKPSL